MFANFLRPDLRHRAFPAVLLPIAVWISNFGWEPPEGDYVGNPAVWVVFAFLLGVAMWPQDRVNASYSADRLFLPVVGIYNGFTFGLAMVLLLAGRVTPEGAIVVFFVTGTLWAIYVVQKISVYQDGIPVDDARLRKTLISLSLAIGAFVMVAQGWVDASLGGAIGFQFLILLPIFESLGLDPWEEKLRRGCFVLGGLVLIFYA